MSVRAFVGIWLPEPFREELLRWRAQVAPLLSQARWVRAEQLHVTLRFLGDVPLDLVKPLEQGLAKIAASRTAPLLSLTRPGVFPSFERPRVLWVGLDSGGQLEELAAEVAALAQDLDFAPDDRPWVPHVTLARARSPWPAEAVERVFQTSGWRSEAPCSPTSLDLIGSELLPDGPRYRVLSASPWRRLA